MSDEQKPTETVAVVVAEETAPELPTSQPPSDEVQKETAAVEEVKDETKPAEEAVAATTEGDAAAEEAKPKKSGGVARRFTFNKRWGKHRDEPAVPKEPEAPKDPKDDILGWIGQQIPQAVHKANYQVLDWVQKTAIENEADRKVIPGKDQSTTRNQFLNFLKDGDVLVKFANKLQAGAIEPAAAEENADVAAQKEVQKKNIDSFSEWVSSATGIENSMKSEDLLEKGKQGYQAVFQTLWQLGLQAKEKFDADGFDVETIVNIASQVVKSNILQTILGFFRRNRQAAAAVEETKEGEPAAAEGEAEAEKPAEEGETVEEPVAVKIETAAPSAVAAN